MRLTFAHILTRAHHHVMHHVKSVDVGDVTRGLTEHGALVRLRCAGSATGAHLIKTITWELDQYYSLYPVSNTDGLIGEKAINSPKKKFHVRQWFSFTGLFHKVYG